MVRKASGESGARRLYWLRAEGQRRLWVESAVCLAAVIVLASISHLVWETSRCGESLEILSRELCTHRGLIMPVLLSSLVWLVQEIDEVEMGVLNDEVMVVLGAVTATGRLAVVLAGGSES